MKFKRVSIALPEAEVKKKTKNKLPPDTYKKVLKGEPQELHLDDEGTKIVFDVTRKGDDGLPHVDIRLHIATESYEGPTKKGLNFDSEYLLDFMEILENINTEIENIK